jgi:hypothetical protein
VAAPHILPALYDFVLLIVTSCHQTDTTLQKNPGKSKSKPKIPLLLTVRGRDKRSSASAAVQSVRAKPRRRGEDTHGAMTASMKAHGS